MGALGNLQVDKFLSVALLFQKKKFLFFSQVPKPKIFLN